MKPAQALPDARILAEIAKRTTVGPRGASVVEVLPALPLTKRWLFKRFAELEARGLIARVSGANGEYVLTPQGSALLVKPAQERSK